jgi:hypothetical protein
MVSLQGMLIRSPAWTSPRIWGLAFLKIVSVNPALPDLYFSLAAMLANVSPDWMA